MTLPRHFFNGFDNQLKPLNKLSAMSHGASLSHGIKGPFGPLRVLGGALPFPLSSPIPESVR